MATIIKYDTFTKKIDSDPSSDAVRSALVDKFPEIAKAVPEIYTDKESGLKVIEFKIKSGGLGK